MSHKITIEQISNNRVALHVNGFMLDVVANMEGIIATLMKGDNNEATVYTELAHDWNEPHINA